MFSLAAEPNVALPCSRTQDITGLNHLNPELCKMVIRIVRLDAESSPPNLAYKPSEQRQCQLHFISRKHQQWSHHKKQLHQATPKKSIKE
jgi:hypothetical protein